ncbi:TPA: hypothetical protein G9E90_002737 [Salmonella enterica]|nr:hypothetical protein [Salmonella enterica]
MNKDKLAKEAENAFYPNLDKLSDEFHSIQNEHPEIYQSEIVNSALDNYGKKLKEVSFESFLSVLIGMQEVERAHEALNNAAKYVLGNTGISE